MEREENKGERETYEPVQEREWNESECLGEKLKKRKREREREEKRRDRERTKM